MNPAATDLYQTGYVRARRALEDAIKRVAGEREDYSMDEARAYELGNAVTSACVSAVNDVLRGILE